MKAHHSSIRWNTIAADGLLAFAWHRAVGRRQIRRSCACDDIGIGLGGDWGVPFKVRTGAEYIDGQHDRDVVLWI